MAGAAGQPDAAGLPGGVARRRGTVGAAGVPGLGPLPQPGERQLHPGDDAQHQAFFHALDADDVRLRFFTAMRELPPSQLARLTQIDYDRAMAFIATRALAGGGAETLGVVRAVLDPANQSAEFAIIIRSDLKGKGLGYILFGKLVDYFRARGTAEIVGDALAENLGVQKLVRHFGGVVLPHHEAGMVRLQLPLK